MQIPKPTAADRERFTSFVPRSAGVEVKPMFGNLGAYVNGNMFVVLATASPLHEGVSRSNVARRR